MEVDKLQLDGLRLEGCSRAGDSTWLRVHPPGVAFDVGRGSVRLAGAPVLFLTHGHLDHALGVPFVLSYRTRHKHEPTRVYCPAAVADALVAFVEAAARFEGAQYRYEVRGLAPGDRVDLAPWLAVEAFATPHVVPSLGYHLLRRRRRLLPELRGRSGPELAELRRRGAELEEEVEEDWLSYCGDTSGEVLEREPRLFTSKVLVIECTFLDPEHRDRGRRYGHVHLADLVPHRERFANDAIVLQHLSRRHRPGELREAVDRHLPELAARIHLFGMAGGGRRPREESVGA